MSKMLSKLVIRIVTRLVSSYLTLLIDPGKDYLLVNVQFYFNSTRLRIMFYKIYCTYTLPINLLWTNSII